MVVLHVHPPFLFLSFVGFLSFSEFYACTSWLNSHFVILTSCLGTFRSKNGWVPRDIHPEVFYDPFWF